MGPAGRVPFNLGDHGDPRVFGPLQLLQLAASLAVDSNTGAEGPARRVPSNLGDHGDPMYLVPSNFCNWLLFFRCALWDAYSASGDLLAEFKGEGNKSRKGNG